MTEQHFNLNLSHENIQIILESLLHCSSVDVMGNFDYEKCMKFLNLAKHIRSNHPSVLTDDLEIIKNENIPFEDSYTTEIIKNFPEIYLSEITV